MMSEYKRNIKTFTVERPWGHFDQFTHNENTTVKIHHIKPHSAHSLQFHNHRSEFMYVVSGHPTLVIGDKNIDAKPGDEFMIDVLQKHRIKTNDDEVVMLEICYGDFNEEDITRIDDKYGRT